MLKKGKQIFILSLFTLFLFALAVLLADSSNQPIDKDTFGLKLADPYTDITPEEAYNMINDDISYPNLIVLDVRTQGEYDSYHICNAILIPYTELDSRISELDPYKDTEIIVYCGSGVRSVIACNILETYDFTKVFNMLGGITAWISEDYELCTDDLNPPVWDEIPTDKTMEYGGSFNYDLDASDPSGIDEWWLNDTTYFEIDGSGIITNNGPVPIGEYWLEVNVNDTYDNTLTDTFKITAEDTTPPSWVLAPTDKTMEYGGSFNYDLDATDLSDIDAWWLNDTMYFDIDGNGVITNLTSINVGIYWLEVSVNDTFGNTLTDTFKITVEDTTPPSWVLAPTDKTMEYSGSFNYDLDASDPSGIDDWWLNDTTYFNIDDISGVITNIGQVPVGSYWLEVNINDTFGNTLTDTFKITVEDTLDPTWDDIPTNQLLEYGEAFNYELNASDPSGIDTWWLNNTMYFDIDANGVITNKSLVPIGEYWLEVTVNDTFSNILTDTFKITVEDTTPPSWAPEPTDQYVDFGDGLNYDLNASDLSGIGSWELNETTHFTINSNGVITNISFINVGIYWLEVRVNDIFNNLRTKALRVLVQDIDTPNWIQIPTDQNIEFGDGLYYDINATDASGIDNWWLNDTTYFTINDANGIITNTTLLSEGIYWLEVRAYDPYGQYCSATFKITVEDTTDPNWIQIPTDQNIEFGDGLYYDINATDASGIDNWWLNDTTYFTINDANGIITNTTLLNEGIYWLEVRAYDPYGQYCSATFEITVEKSTIPGDQGFIMWIIVIGSGSTIGLAIIISLVVRKKRRAKKN